MEGEPSTPTASEPGCAADEGRTGDRPRSSYTKQADRRRYRQSRILPTTLEDKQDEVAKRLVDLGIIGVCKLEVAKNVF